MSNLENTKTFCNLPHIAEHDGCIWVGVVDVCSHHVPTPDRSKQLGKRVHQSEIAPHELFWLEWA